MNRSLWRCVGVVALVFAAGLGALAEPCTITVQPGESIQAAIDAAPEGAVICLAEGEWEENLEIGKSLTLRGKGPDRTTIGDHVWDVSVVRVQVGQVILEGLSVTGSADHGIMIQDSAQVTMRDCTVTDNRRAGIRVQNAAQITITDSTVQANRRGGITLSDEAQATITRSVFRDNDFDGITLVGYAQVTISESELHGNEGGIWMEGSSQAVIVDTTLTENEFEGIYMEESTEATITNCTVSSNNEGGIVMVDAARATVIDCTIADNVGAAVVLADNARITLEGNRIVRSAYWNGEGGYGVMVAGTPCTEWGSFSGYVTGKANWIPGPGEHDGNVGGAVCPTEIGFLMTQAGGELDRRE